MTKKQFITVARACDYDACYSGKEKGFYLKALKNWPYDVAGKVVNLLEETGNLTTFKFVFV